MTIQINGEWEDSRIYSSSSTTDTNRYNSMGGEFWFYYHWMQIPLLNYTKQSSLPHNFWGKEENQSVTNHHGAFCCHNLCFHPVHRASWLPEHGDQVRALAVVMYRSVTNWVIIISASKRSIRRFVITVKAPTRTFFWLKVATTAFTFKTLLRHYAKQTMTPRSLNMK